MLNSKAWLLHLLERYDEALITVNKSLSIRSNHIDTIHTKGRILLKLKQYDNAIHYFDMTLKIDPEYKDSIKDRQLAADAAKLDK